MNHVAHQRIAVRFWHMSQLVNIDGEQRHVPIGQRHGEHANQRERHARHQRLPTSRNLSVLAPSLARDKGGEAGENEHAGDAEQASQREPLPSGKRIVSRRVRNQWTAEVSV